MLLRTETKLQGPAARAAACIAFSSSNLPHADGDVNPPDLTRFGSDDIFSFAQGWPMKR
jgi:hypothetical protein